MSEKFDDASWHIDSVDAKLPEERRWAQAGAHIALFVRWLADRDLFDSSECECEADVVQLRSGALTASKFIAKNLDYKLVEHDIRESALPFVRVYYGKSYFLGDVSTLFGDLVFEKTAEELDYQRLRERLDHRFEQFKTDGEKAFGSKSMLNRLTAMLGFRVD